MYVYKRDLNGDSDGSYMTSFRIRFMAEEEAKEIEGSPSDGLLCAGLLRRDMVYEQERELRVFEGFFDCISVTYDGEVLLWQW